MRFAGSLCAIARTHVRQTQHEAGPWTLSLDVPRKFLHPRFDSEAWFPAAGTPCAQPTAGSVIQKKTGEIASAVACSCRLTRSHCGLPQTATTRKRRVRTPKIRTLQIHVRSAARESTFRSKSTTGFLQKTTSSRHPSASGACSLEMRSQVLQNDMHVWHQVWAGPVEAAPAALRWQRSVSCSCSKTKTKKLGNHALGFPIGLSAPLDSTFASNAFVRYSRAAVNAEQICLLVARASRCCNVCALSRIKHMRKLRMLNTSVYSRYLLRSHLATSYLTGA